MLPLLCVMVVEWKKCFVPNNTQVCLVSVCSSPLICPAREGVVQLGLLPFYHIYAVMATFITSMSRGQTSVIVPGFDPRVFLEVVPKFKVGRHNL